MDSAQSKASTYHLYQFQVSGKAPKLSTDDNKIILKCHIKQQQNFYSHFQKLSNTQFSYSLKKFIPNYKGTINLQTKPYIEHDAQAKNKELHEWLGHVKNRYDMKNQGHKFVLMENFLFGIEKQNILDIKIGSRKEKPNKITHSVSKYKLKLNGMLKTDENGNNEFKSKYILNQIEEYQQIAKNIAFFFTVKEQLQIDLLKSSFNQLKDFILSFRCTKGWKYSSASICIVYDTKNTQKCLIKFIDFGRAYYNELYENYDVDTCDGAENIVKIMQYILQNKDSFKDLKMKRQQKQVVPEKKKIKFKTKQSGSFEISSPLR